LKCLYHFIEVPIIYYCNIFILFSSNESN
jgi:hypothetical protein